MIMCWFKRIVLKWLLPYRRDSQNDLTLV
ncbi:hypothetical protein Gotri_020670 [Gossypium trilobum]|uniref:Uncharacterized protein n=1 Tax=Gossypium trilobum TaxID=34281 RepID=A0A7J9DA35_9ROSI|nr:hypothetical protein [Gossypium trilobum]